MSFDHKTKHLNIILLRHIIGRYKGFTHLKLLTLGHLNLLHEERRSWLLSNGRCHGSASYTELFGKKEESGTLSILNAFLDAICERPHEMHKEMVFIPPGVVPLFSLEIWHIVLELVLD